MWVYVVSVYQGGNPLIHAACDGGHLRQGTELKEVVSTGVLADVAV